MAKKKRGGMIPGGMDSVLKKTVRDSTAKAPASSAEKTLKGAKPLPPHASVAPTTKNKRVISPEGYATFSKSLDGGMERGKITRGDYGAADGIQKSKKAGTSSRGARRSQEDYFAKKIYWIRKNNPSVRGITKNKKGEK